MDPISLALGVAGLGLSIFGGMKSASDSRAAAGVSANIALQEGKENDVRQELMNLQGRRADIQTLRNSQRARAMGVASATNQGAQYGSGLQGAKAENTAETAWGLQGITQQLTAGNKLYDINKVITSDKMQLAYLGGQQATDQGIASLGGSLLSIAKPAGSLFADSSKGGGMFFNGPWNLNFNA